MVGNRIKKLREELDLKQDELAQKLGVSPSAIGMYERNLREANDDIKLKMCHLFDCSMDYLTGLSDIRNPKESNVMPLPDAPIKVPIIGRISAGLPLLASENIEGYEFAPSSQIKEGFEYFYLRVSRRLDELKI